MMAFLGWSGLALLALEVLHPYRGVFWFDNAMIVDAMARVASPLDAVKFQRAFHPTNYVRPVRALVWWAETHLVGTAPLGHHLVTLLALAACVILAGAIARKLHASPLAVGGALLVSYVTACYAMYIGYSVTFGLGLLGVYLYLCGQLFMPYVLLLLAALSHETFVVLALLPVCLEVFPMRDCCDTSAHQVESEAPIVRAGILACVVPVYAVLRVLHAWIFATTRVEFGPWSFENAARVSYTLLSGGIPLDRIRDAPWLPPFLRIHEMLATPSGFLTALAFLVPSVTLTVLSLRQRWDRALTYGAWILLSSLPLMLPVAAPENFHLMVACVGLFLLWGSWKWTLPAKCCFALWCAIQLWAQVSLFWVELPEVARVTHALERTTLTRVSGVPLQIGPHYAMLPASSYAGCLDQPTWIWRGQTRPATRLIEHGGVKRNVCP